MSEDATVADKGRRDRGLNRASTAPRLRTVARPREPLVGDHRWQEWQAQPNRGAYVFLAGERESSAVLLDDLLGARKSKPGTRVTSSDVAGAKEAVEHTRNVGARNAYSVICHGQDG